MVNKVGRNHPCKRSARVPMLIDTLGQWKSNLPGPSNEFSCMFRFRRGDDLEEHCAVGAAVEVRVTLLDGKELEYVLAREGQVQLVERICYGSDMLYPLMFQNLSGFLRRAKDSCFDGGDHPAVFFGGWKAITRPAHRVEIARFTCPRIWASVLRGRTRIVRHGPTRKSVSVRPRMTELPQIIGMEDIPGYASYTGELRELLIDLNQDETKKVVVARKARVRLERPVDALEILRCQHERGFDEVYSYVFQWDGDEALVGVSPEILLTMSGSEFSTWPLAGTRKVRPGSEHIRELLADPKEDREHRAAVDLMMSDLKSISEPGSLRCKSKGIVQLKYVCHLKTEICGTVRRGVDALGVLSNIYPPATVWGVPRGWSGQQIARLEPFDRGYYTGGLGYFTSHGTANFALAIRTAALRGTTLDVFAGSGVVAGAVPEMEWKETAAKMRPFLDCFPS